MPEQYVLKDELAKEVVKSMKPNLGGRRVMGNKDSLDIELKENKILTDLKENSLKQNDHLQKISYSMSAIVGFERDKQRRTKDQQTELARELKKTMARGGAMGGVAGSPKTESGEGDGMGLIGRALSVLGLTSVAKGGVGLLGKMRGTKLGGGTERFFGVNKGYTPRAAKKLGVGGTAKALGKRSLGGLSKMATGKAGVLSALFAIPSLMLDYSSMKKAQAEGDEREEDLAKEGMAGTVGGTGGALAGAAVGSVVPVIGTAIGGIVGGLIGGFGGSKLGEGLFKTREEKKAEAAKKKKKEEELIKKMNANITPKDVKKEVEKVPEMKEAKKGIEKVPEMKEAKKGIDMTKKETSVAKADTTIMDKQVDYTDEAAKKFDEKINKEISTNRGTDRAIDAKSAKEAEQYLKAGEKLAIAENFESGPEFMAVKTVTAEGDEDVKKFYTETYNDFRNAIDNYIKRSLKNGDLDPKTGQWSDPLARGAYTRFYDDLLRPMRAKINAMKDVNTTKQYLLSNAIVRAGGEAHNESMKSNLGTGGDKKSFFGKISDFFKGIQGVEAGTAGDIAAEASMENAATTETQKPEGKQNIFSKFKTALKGLAKVSPVAGAAMAIMDKNKMPEENAQFGEIPEDQSLEGAQFGDIPTETKPKTLFDIKRDRAMNKVLNPEDGNYYPPDSPVLKKFKPNQLRSVKDILDSGQSTQQASAMAVSNNNVNNVSNNSNQNIYTGKLNVDVDNYAERVNDF